MKSWFHWSPLKFYVHRGQDFTPMFFCLRVLNSQSLLSSPGQQFSISTTKPFLQVSILLTFPTWDKQLKIKTTFVSVTALKSNIKPSSWESTTKLWAKIMLKAGVWLFPHEDSILLTKYCGCLIDSSAISNNSWATIMDHNRTMEYYF